MMNPKRFTAPLLAAFGMLCSQANSLAASMFTWSGSIEHVEASYELGGDFYHISAATQDVVLIPSQYGAAISVTLNSGTWPEIRIFPGLTGFRSFEFESSGLLGTTRTWIQPSFDPDPDATPLPDQWYMVISSENELQSRWEDAPSKTAPAGIPSYHLTFSVSGAETLSVKEGEFILPVGQNGLQSRFVTHTLFAVPEPSVSLLAGLALLGLKRRNRGKI